MAVKYKTRAQWGGRSRKFNTVSPRVRTEFFVHYDGPRPVTHTGDTIIQRIERYHASIGWNGTGYNFVVDQQGNVYEGRGWNGVGAHCKNHNRSGIGVQVAIGANQTPSKAALKKVRELYDEACERSGKTLRKMGHRDGRKTACPGEKLYDWVKKGMPAGHGAAKKPLNPPTKDKSISQLADEVLEGQHGSGADRKKSLGDQYQAVQDEVNNRLGVGAKKPAAKEKTTAQLAQEVIDGKHGTGAARKKALGRRYSAVQAEVNRRLGASKKYRKPAKTTAQLAREVLDGKHGDGDARKRSLGRRYSAVQREVNRLLS